jgi:two-component system, sensor histidine kinase and response regulator
VLMDVQMPELDGFETTGIIRQLESRRGTHVPIVGVTAHAMKGDRERCLAAGMDAYVAKPIRPEALLDAIDAAVLRRSHCEEPVSAADSVVFDEAGLLALVLGDRDAAREIANVFLEDGPNRLAEIRNALEIGDRERLRQAAHTLKGSAGTICGGRTADAALRVETMAATADFSALREACAALVMEAELLQRALGPVAARAA